MPKKDIIEIEIVGENPTFAAAVDIEVNAGKTKRKAQEKAEKVFNERAEARRLVSLANKRMRRLEAAGMTENPAYKATGGKPFSVRGKTQTEIQRLLR